jgi:ABC-type dipeptide/oligopeptide/nickel transport system permease component
LPVLHLVHPVNKGGTFTEATVKSWKGSSMNAQAIHAPLIGSLLLAAALRTSMTRARGEQKAKEHFLRAAALGYGEGYILETHALRGRFPPLCIYILLLYIIPSTYGHITDNTCIIRIALPVAPSFIYSKLRSMGVCIPESFFVSC